MAEPVRVANPPYLYAPCLPPEIIDIILAPLGHSSDRAMRNTLIACSLVSRCFCDLARKYYFRKLIIKQFIDYQRPLPEREYHLIHFFFSNPDLLGLIKELDIMYDSTFAEIDADDSVRVPRYRDTDSPISQKAILDRFPGIGPRRLGLQKTLPLYFLLRQSPIHTARFILKNNGEGSRWYTTDPNHLVSICSIPALKRVYFVSMSPAGLFQPSGPIPTGLERVELLWVAQSEEELKELESLPLGIGSRRQALASPTSSVDTTPHHFPLRQVIRMNRFNSITSIWLQPSRFFESWFPDYEPSPALQEIFSRGLGIKCLLDIPEVRSVLKNMHNTCPPVQRVTYRRCNAEGQTFVEIIIERRRQ